MFSQLCQIAAVIANSRCTTRATMPSGVRPPCRSKSSWPLRVVDGLNDLPQGLEESGPGARLLVLAGRAQQLEAGPRHGVLELATKVVFCPRSPTGGPRPPAGAGSWPRSRPGCSAEPGDHRASPRPGRSRWAGPAGCRPGAGAAPKTSVYARGDTRIRPTRPGPNGAPFPVNARIRQVWNPRSRHGRC